MVDTLNPHIIERIFQEDPKRSRDANDPLNSAYFNERSKISNQALATWYKEFGGIEAINQITENIRGNLRLMITRNLTKPEGRDTVIDLLRDIQSQIHFVSIIESAFESEQKRQEALKAV